MRVLLTGGSSLLARSTAERLLARGDEVVLFQRSPAALDVPQVLGDVRDADLVERAVGECDAVIHLAAKVGVVGSWDDYRSINVDGTANVVAAARRHGIARMVHVSTPSVAHAGEALVGVGATPAVTGRSGAWYAESKAIAEHLVQHAAGPQLPIVVIRPHLVSGICRAAGVDITPRRVPRRLAVGAGALVERVWALRGPDAGEPPLTRFLAEQLGTAHWFDPRPARDDLGWSPTVTVDEGLARLAASFATP
jgi:nucleoside-diphosphate-sugar epimerase